eukprot:3516371-Pleurochrysis_carterae.AAC.1
MCEIVALDTLLIGRKTYLRARRWACSCAAMQGYSSMLCCCNALLFSVPRSRSHTVAVEELQLRLKGKARDWKGQAKGVQERIRGEIKWSKRGEEGVRKRARARARARRGRGRRREERENGKGVGERAWDGATKEGRTGESGIERGRDRDGDETERATERRGMIEN